MKIKTKVRPNYLLPPGFTYFQIENLIYEMGLLSWKNFTDFDHKVSGTFEFECKHDMIQKERSFWLKAV